MMAKVSRSLAYEWRDADPEWNEKITIAMKISLENGLDFAESKLIENINRGKENSIMFFLKTKGKNRGYIDRIAVQGDKSADPVQIDVTAAVTTDPATRAMFDALNAFASSRASSGKPEVQVAEGNSPTDPDNPGREAVADMVDPVGARVG